jgi:hypothetical protein
MMALSSVNQMEHINTVCRKNAEFCNVKAGGKGKKKGKVIPITGHGGP